ncbi:MAG: GvpL/GvpF family gas vesicle protein [Deltaproteobacteria bacterium]|nr:GvpL/GvpF family gas vesicle protein [Deltaproteobacteria bacterium]
MDGKYLYGFVQTPNAMRLDIAGMDQKMLNTIPYRDIAAVVSDAVPIIWSDLPRETVFSYLTTHQAAIEAVMERYEIIPAKFGTYLPNKNLVHLVLKTEYHPIRSILAEMANRIEMDVVVLWRDLANLFNKIAGMPEVDDIKRQMAEEKPNQYHNLRIQAGKKVKAFLDSMNAACANEVMDALTPVSLARQPHEVKDDEMILNCAFLVETHRLDAFEKQIDALDNRHHNQLTFRMIGPLPPYSFRTLEIERLDANDIENARTLFSLGKTATELEIRARYREMAKTLHPDRFPEDPAAQNRFELFNKAYEILKAYCRGDACSFEPADIQNWIAVRPMKYTAGTR